MTKEDIIELASDAGFSIIARDEERNERQVADSGNLWITERILEFAKLVAAKEREECAKLAEQTVCDTHIQTGYKIYGGRAAKAIRGRVV